jgi:Tfp pilus assembly protein PilV
MKKSSKGISLVEVLVAAAIIATSVAGVIGVYGGLTSLSIKNTPRVQAAMLLEEGAEAVKMMRDSGWTRNIGSLSNNTAYGLVWNSSTGWGATTTVSLIDGFFYRTVTFSQVSRDTTSFDIVSSDGAVDAHTKKAIISVAWKDGTATTTKTVEMYVHNRFSN